jgi:hypothetical protein
MAHEIHVVAGAGVVLDPAELAANLAGAGWQAVPDGTAWAYANPDTGARATIEPRAPEARRAADRGPDLGLVLNYVRPSWFALEVIPGFCRALAAARGLVVDPQAGDPRPVSPNSEALIASWRHGNDAAVGSIRGGGTDLPWLEPSDSMTWWRQQLALPRLRVAFADEYYVPSVRLVRRSGDNRVLRAMSWPNDIPTLLPECDLIIRLRSDPLVRFIIDGVVSASVIRERLDDLTDRIGSGIEDLPEMRRLRPGLETLVAERLKSVALEPFEGFETVAPEGFVDVPRPGF